MSDTPMSREQVLELIELNCYPQKLRDHDALLRSQLDLSMQRQETLAANVNAGLLEIRALRARVVELEKALQRERHEW